MKTYNPHHHNRRGLIVALLIIIAGCLLLASNTGSLLSPYKQIIFSWPMLLVVIGFLGLLKHRRFSFGALFVVLLGCFFLIPRIGASDMTLWGWDIPENFVRIYNPVMIILGGVTLLVQRLVRRNEDPARIWAQHCRTKKHGQKDAGRLDVNSAFDSARHTIFENQFDGGEVNVAFGESVIDLRKCTLAEGVSRLEISAVFSSATVLVPNDWELTVKSSNFCAGIVDKRSTPEQPRDTSRVLIVECKCVFSSCEIKN